MTPPTARTSSLLLALLLAAPVLTSTVRAEAKAEDPLDSATEEYGRRVSEGQEVGMVLPTTKSRDGQIAILYNARKKGVRATKWPFLLKEFNILGSSVEGEDLETENTVVSMPDKKRLGVIKSVGEETTIYHPNELRYELLAAWTPDSAGARAGFIAFCTEKYTYDLQLANIQGGTLVATSLMKTLGAATAKFTSAQKDFKKGLNYEPYFKVAGSEIEKKVLPRGTTALYNLPFSSRIVRGGKASLEGTINGSLQLRLTRSAEGALSAAVEGVSTMPAPDSGPAVAIGGSAPAPKAPSATAPAAAAPAPPAPITKAPATMSEFTDLRVAYNTISDGKAWKEVRKDLPKTSKSQRHYVLAWVEGQELKMMMHVDAATEADSSITFYYYYEGALTSVFQRRKGAATQMSDVGMATETYNFAAEKLVGWKRTPIEGGGDGLVPKSDPGFAEAGKEVFKKSLELSGPIFRLMKAD